MSDRQHLIVTSGSIPEGTRVCVYDRSWRLVKVVDVDSQTGDLAEAVNGEDHHAMLAVPVPDGTPRLASLAVPTQ